MAPVRSPLPTDTAILLVPFLGQQFQIAFRFRFRGSPIVPFQVSGDLFAMLVGDIFEGIAHQMHHIQLDSSLQVERFDASGRLVSPSTQARKISLSLLFELTVHLISPGHDENE